MGKYTIPWVFGNISMQIMVTKPPVGHPKWWFCREIPSNIHVRSFKTPWIYLTCLTWMRLLALIWMNKKNGWIPHSHSGIAVCHFQKVKVWYGFALPETTIAPENGWLEYYLPLGMPFFFGYVSLRAGIDLMSLSLVVTGILGEEHPQLYQELSFLSLAILTTRDYLIKNIPSSRGLQ